MSTVMPSGGVHVHYDATFSEVEHYPHKVGAIVALVEIVGPSHHADECASPYFTEGGKVDSVWFCHPDALPDCWHTPTGTVTRIDPIVCEQPFAQDASEYDAAHGPPWTPKPASHWVVDDVTAEKIRKATA